MEVLVDTWAGDPAAAESRLARAPSLLRETLGAAPAADISRTSMAPFSWRGS